MTAERDQLDADVERVHAYFRAQGVEPTLFAVEFFEFWVGQGYSPQQIWAIANNAHDEPGYGFGV